MNKGGQSEPFGEVPRLLAVATATPSVVLERADIIAGAQRVFGDSVERLLAVYANAGIERRHSCVPLGWYLHPHGWSERNRIFVSNAIDLLDNAIRKCLAEAHLTCADVDALVIVSSTGVATPSLDALLIERLGMRPDTCRLPVFGLGCVGGALGIARASAMARADPGRNVLLGVVELCGLTFRSNDQSKSNMVATALFGDGAAAALIRQSADDLPAVVAWGDHTWPGSLDVMGWHVEDDGFGVLFSPRIPSLVRDSLRPAVDDFLARQGLALDRIDRCLCHPGGTKVLAALESALDLESGTLDIERAVLRDFGNMSAATLLFILERALARGLPPLSLLTALGPGFTAGFVLVASRGTAGAS